VSYGNSSSTRCETPPGIPGVRGSVAIFLATLVPFGIISIWYNEVRFGSLLDTGLDEIYDKYNGVAYTP
jgi:hypothetical protein